MRGKVEIFHNYGKPDQELVYEGKNTIVDGAGELLADAMCAHTSLSGIPNLSSILDASNYTLQAISFGKDSAGYQKNAHTLNLRKGKAAWENPFVRVALVSSSVDQFITDSKTSQPVSSYDPSFAGNILPTYATPRQRQLELNALTSGTINTGSNTYDLSAWTRGSTLGAGANDVGHNLNTIAYASSLGLASSSSPGGIHTISYSSASGLAGIFGCYPAASSMGGTSFFVVSSDSGLSEDTSSNYTQLVTSGVFKSLFNSVSSMDTSGFVNFVGSSLTDTQLIAGLSGLTVSANTLIDNVYHTSNTGEIAYKVVVGSGDLGMANLFGGIYNIGLWSMDLCAALKANNPPFAFHPLTNQKKYKLFSKRSLLDNIAKTYDSKPGSHGVPGFFNYEDLTLIWRIFFV